MSMQVALLFSLRTEGAFAILAAFYTHRTRCAFGSLCLCSSSQAVRKFASMDFEDIIRDTYMTTKFLKICNYKPIYFSTNKKHLAGRDCNQRDIKTPNTSFVLSCLFSLSCVRTRHQESLPTRVGRTSGQLLLTSHERDLLLFPRQQKGNVHTGQGRLR